MLTESFIAYLRRKYPDTSRVRVRVNGGNYFYVELKNEH